MRLLVVTWDGAGSLEPIVALVNALIRHGHDVHVLGHDAQRSRIEATGAPFVAYETARQLDHGRRETWGTDRLASFLSFVAESEHDVVAIAGALKPAAVLVDCMMPTALRASKREGYRTVALVHAPYSLSQEFMDGQFRKPIEEADLAVGFSYAGFDPGAMPPNLIFVGPARPATSGDVWERAHPELPFVVASQCTGLQGLPGTQLDLLQRVCDAVAGLGVEALVTTGRGIAALDLRLGANTTAVRHVPHEATLPHADLFITHAGLGSVMVALTLGVPMLCLPPGADQPANAANVARLGLGETIDPASPSTEIRTAVKRLLANAVLRRRSHAFAASVVDHPGIERAVELIEAIGA